nr:MAG TPA: hypothetical protein [Bacteriophage sp.]
MPVNSIYNLRYAFLSLVRIANFWYSLPCIYNS